MLYLRTLMLSLLLLASAVAAFAQVTNSAAQSDAAITISISTQGVGFTALSRVEEMRLEVFNSVGETVYTHLKTPLASEATLDWNLRAGDGEPLAAGLYSYVLTLKFGAEQSRQQRGNLIIERDRQQVWLTAQDGATVSGTFTRSGERSLTGFRMPEDQPVKRDVSGRELIVEKLGNSQQAVTPEKAALLGTANMVAKFDAGGVNLIDSAITETGGNVGVGTTSPNAKLTVNANSNVPPSAPLGTVAYFANPNEGNTFMTADAYGSTGNYHSDFLFRRARGTMAAPSAIMTDDIVGQVQMRGYGATGFATTSRAGIRMTAAENWSDTAQGAYLAFMTTPKLSNAINVERMRITDAGNVGIGTTNPSVKLDVAGDLQVIGNAVVSGNIAAKYQDVAEWVTVRQKLAAGTVVSLDATRNNAVVSSTRAYDTHVAGVISAQPGVILGEGGEGKAMVATTGRVKVKVDATRRPIKIGDLLVTSGKSGLAMKSQPISLGGARLHRPGTIIGKALEPLAKGRGEILVLLSLQ